MQPLHPVLRESRRVGEDLAWAEMGCRLDLVALAFRLAYYLVNGGMVAFCWSCE